MRSVCLSCWPAGMLSLRALYLLAVFSPFLVLGTALLLLALLCSRQRARNRRHARLHQGQGHQGASAGAEGRSSPQQQPAPPLLPPQQQQGQLRVGRKDKRAQAERARKRTHAMGLLPAEVAVVLSAVEESGEGGGEGEGGPWLWWLESRSRRVAWDLLLSGCRWVRGGGACARVREWRCPCGTGFL